MAVTIAGRFAPTRLARTFVALLGGLLSARAIRFVYVIVLARLIEPSELGIYLYGIALYVALIGLAGFGQNLLLAARAPHRAAVAAWFAHSLTIRIGAIGLAGAAGLAFVWAQESEPTVRAAATLFMGALVARSLAAWVREAHVALEDAAWIPRFEAGFRAGEAVLGIALVLAGLGVVWLAALHFAVWAAEAAASVRLMVRRGRWPSRIGRSRRLLAPMVGASFWHMAGTGLIIVFAQAGVVELRLFAAPTAALGQFAVAMQGLLALILVPSALAAALVPAFSRARRSGAGDDQRAVATLMRWTLAAGAALAVLAEGYGEAAVALVLGPRYAEAAGLFTVLAWGVGPYAGAIFAVQALNVLDRARRKLAAATAAAMVVAQTALLGVLYPALGAFAASAAVIAGALLGCAAGAVSLGPVSQVRGVAWWLVPLFVTAGAAALMRLVPVEAPLLAPIILIALLGALVATRVVAREELTYIARRFGHGTPGQENRAVP